MENAAAVQCPACDAENPVGNKFCGGCGRPLKLRCASCAFENPPGFKFCGNCGQPLRTRSATDAPATTRDPTSYTPRHLAEKILVSRSAIEGERKQVTVLFADIECSMELAEQVDAEEWHRVLDRFFAILADGVHRFEGTVNQFTGDGIMALFGAPIAHENHAQRACHAALELSEALRRYGEELKRTRGLGLSVRMGLNSGEVVVGRIGDDLRMDYTAQGHTVGLAARMEQLAGPERIYLTEHTAALVSGYFRLRDLGPFALKGVREPIGTYELEGLGPVRTRLQASQARGFSRFVARDEEMKTLEDALARARAGEGLVIGVVAEAGVGKSRLCYELTQRCRARGIHFTEGHALPHGRMIPYQPFIDQLRDDFGITEEDADETARERIAGRALRLDESLGESLPLLFELLGVPDPGRPAPASDPEARQRLLADVIQRLLRARSRREPGLVLFEDLHWMDSGSESLLAALVETVPATRTLLVLTLRPEYRAPWMAEPGYRELALRPLGSAGMAELLASMLGRDPSLAALAELISRQASGNPLFIEEVVQSLREAGALTGPIGDHRLAKPIERLEIPATVQAILAARIDRLDEREKSVLQTAAVIGESFTEPVLAQVAEIAPAELRNALHALVAAGLMYADGLMPFAEYAFKHPLTQEVAYRSQLAASRARIHERVARALVAAGEGKLDGRAALVAHHYEAAGDKLEAARWNRRAARWLRARNVVESATHWRNVVALVDQVPESAETTALALEARAAMLSCGWLLGISTEEADRLYGESRALAIRAGDARAEALLTAQYAGIKAAHRELDEYVRLSWEAVRIAERTGNVALRAAVWPPLVRSHLLCGRLRQALDLTEQGLAAIPADPNFGALLGYSPYLNLQQLRANLLAYAGRWPEAARTFELGIDVAREHGHQGLLGSAADDYGWWAALFGDPPLALAQARRGLEIAEKIGSQMARVYSYAALGFAELAAGRARDAVAPLEQALRIARESRAGEEAAVQTYAHLAEALLASGDTARARELAETAVDMAARYRALPAECFARIVHARVVLALDGAGGRTSATDALARALELVETTGARCYEPLIWVEHAELARLAGDPSGRERELRRAQALFAEMGAGARAASLARELDG